MHGFVRKVRLKHGSLAFQLLAGHAKEVARVKHYTAVCEARIRSIRLRAEASKADRVLKITIKVPQSKGPHSLCLSGCASTKDTEHVDEPLKGQLSTSILTE